MRIAVVDDEKMYRELIFNIVKNESENIDIYESGERFLEADKEYELIFMDIEMGGLDGIEVSTIYHKDYPDAIICLVTTHTEMVQNGYKARAFRFIYKEKIREEVEEALASAKAEMKQYEKIIFNTVNNRQMEIIKKDIIFIETEKRNVVIHTKYGDEITSETINHLYERLWNKGFCCPHKSYIVNMQ